MSTLISSLLELGEYEEIKKDLERRRGPVALGGCIDAAKAHLLHGFSGFGQKLVVTYSDSRAKELYEDIRFFDKNVWLYPAKDLLFYNADIHGNLLTGQRLAVLRALMEGREGTVITTIDGCMDYLVPLEIIKNARITLASGDILEVEEMKHRLVHLGYERVAQVEGLGQFCMRGGILDIFPLTEENPLRIELWGDEIDSIRSFDVESQRSVETLDEIMIYPASEIVLSEDAINDGIRRMERECKTYEKALREQAKNEEAHRIKTIIGEIKEELTEGFFTRGLDGFVKYFYKNTCTFASYFPKDTLIVLDEPARLAERADAIELEFKESMIHRLEKGYLLPGQTDMLHSVRETFVALSTSTTVTFSGLEQKCEYLKPNLRHSLTIKNVSFYQNHFEELIKDLTHWKKEKYRVVLLSASKTRAERLAGDLQEYGLLSFYGDCGRTVEPGQILVTWGNLHKGFEYPFIRFVVITESDMFGAEKKKRRKKHSYEGKKIQNFTELSPGDYVIHENHGLGIYRGIEKIEVGGNTRDYIKIEYGGGGNLYTPVTQMDIVQKYADADAKKPKLNRLGGSEWKNTKTRVRGAVKEIARDLVELYAARQRGTGYEYGSDTVWQREFEEMFPYEETADQLEAIEATKRDMESTKIMDRLVCGDVGFGKTEIAIRAAFKAVQEEKQVVYLVPTTILAQQHYNTFVQRMKDFPVRVDLLSRFCTPTQVKGTLEGLRKGTVDIVIGTHKVLSKDVVFKNLGLLIIDEEQRFGVTHKEKIKKMKENVDVLTLTATPIPRTLHMSMIGIRDMSVLEEAPLDRLPIQTYVMEYNEEMIREAITREIVRGGQVYYVFNRVKNIEDITAKIAELVPQANVTYAHGQMSERQLEKIMLEFINGEIDVLVSTTIIETGLDISNANTIIIHDADKFGLSQLYQLRGRVGRANRTSYAFLMYKRDKLLREEAEKRLQAIREYTELGSGIKIAMRDLEIRGAGNLLGAEQHGHMEAVGYDLYCKMLNTAVRALKGEVPEETFDTTIDLDIDAYIPASYIRNEAQKLDIYKRISAIETEDEHMDMQDELIDRFGEMPRAVEQLLKVALLKARAHEAQITEVSGNKEGLKFVMYAKASVDPAFIPPLIEKYRGQLKFAAGESPAFTYSDRKKQLNDGEMLLTKTMELIDEILLLKR